MKLSKQQEDDYQTTLRAASGDSFGIALVALEQHYYEQVKERLVDCTIEEFQVLQGQAQVHRHQLKYLKERPLTTTKV